MGRPLLGTTANLYYLMLRGFLTPFTIYLAGDRRADFRVPVSPPYRVPGRRDHDLVKDNSYLRVTIGGQDVRLEALTIKRAAHAARSGLIRLASSGFRFRRASFRS